MRASDQGRNNQNRIFGDGREEMRRNKRCEDSAKGAAKGQPLKFRLIGLFKLRCGYGWMAGSERHFGRVLSSHVTEAMARKG
jgi:hypothetical protein